MKTLSPAFWDKAHERESIPLLGDTSAEDYYRIFNRISDDNTFTDEVRLADTIYEVGPGLARFLADPTIKRARRHAYDISPVNRRKLRKLGISTAAPKDQTVDVAVALSVLQHCSSAQVQDIFHKVSCALAPSGSFYCNGIVCLDGYTLLPGISISRPLDAVIRMGLDAGLLVGGVKEYRVEGAFVKCYLLRFEVIGCM